MAMSYPMCVFLESREKRLPVHHPFYRVVEQTLQSVIQCPVVMRYLAMNTLENSDSVTEEQRAQEIINYLQNSCPTFSGSNSPAMDSTFVDMRAYSGCGKDRKSRKTTRKHVYIQKCLVDTWVKAFHKSNNPQGYFSLLTFLVKLCLLRGLTAAVIATFTSGNVRDNTAHPCSAWHKSPCTLERFLSRWNTGWLVFQYGVRFDDNMPHKKVPYDKLDYMFFTDLFYSVLIGPVNNGYSYTDQLAAGNWTAFPPTLTGRHGTFEPRYLQMWNSPPTGDPKHKRIETMPPQSAAGYIERMSYSALQRVEEKRRSMGFFFPFFLLSPFLLLSCSFLFFLVLSCSFFPSLGIFVHCPFKMDCFNRDCSG